MPEHPTTPTAPTADTTVHAVADALFAYGQAIRGDWSNLDGRCVRDTLHHLADALYDVLRGDGDGFNLAGWAVGEGVCLRCNSWTEHCHCAAENGAVRG